MKNKFLLVLAASTAISTNIFAMAPADESKKTVQGLQSEQIDRLSVLSDEEIRHILGEMVHGVEDPEDVLNAIKNLVRLRMANKKLSDLLSVEEIACILKQNIDVNKSYSLCQTALHYAAMKGQAGCVRILLAAGANVNAVNWYNHYTALHYAASYGHAECVRILLAAGANVNANGNAVDRNGHTALRLAAAHGHADCVRALLAAGANVNAVDSDGCTVLYLAVNCAHDYDCVRTLLAAGANVNAVDPNGCTALHLAAAYGRDDCVRALLVAGANVNAVDRNGHTALHLAAAYGHKDCAREIQRSFFLRRNACKIVSGAVAAAVAACAIAGGSVYLTGN